MEAFGMYLFKSSVWMVGFALVYALFLRNERFFILNRIYLISGIICSALFPLFLWHYTVLVPEAPIVPDVESFRTSIPYVTENRFSNENIVQLLLILGYFSGIIFLLYRNFKHTLPVFRIIHRSEKHALPSAQVIRNAEYPASFSFFSFVFIHPSISDNETNEIVNHELEHIRQKHWIDLMLFEMLRLLQWFNPVIWLYGHYIRQNHEYLADRYALQKSTNPAVYRAALLNQMFDTQIIALSNTLNYSLNKKRFQMMKQTISSPIRKLKLLLIVPMIVGVFYAFAAPEYKVSSIGESQTGSNPLYVITKDKIDIQFTTQFTKADLESVKTELANLGLTIDYISTVFNENGNLKEISASIKFPDGAGGSFSGKDLPTNPPGPGFKMNEKGEFGFYVPQSVHGKVVAKDGKPLNGAIIIVGGKSKGTSTDADGRFQLLLTDHTPIIISYVGYKTTLVKPDFSQEMIIQLSKENISIDPVDVSIIGYGAAPDGPPKKNIYQIVEEMPEFPGGQIALREFIGTKLRYPVQAQIDTIQGKVFVNFVVNETGKVEQIKIAKGVHPLLDAEAMRVVALLPDWTPGKQKGVNVAVSYTVPINFSLKQNSGIQIRAAGSLNNEKPLLVVDGQIVENSQIQDMNPETFKSVNVLKGEVAVQKYGEKGKNGVIEVNTKIGNPSVPVNDVFFVVEQMPEFPGGDEALRGFIANSIQYPAEAAAKGITGKVYVSFVIGKDGKVIHANVARGVDPLLDAEALRVVSNLPDWLPGRQKGEAVNVQYTVPINFNLTFEKEKPAADAVAEKQKLTVMPNLAKDLITINLSDADPKIRLRATILDNNGKKRIEVSKLTSPFTIDVKKLKAGIYILVVDDGSKKYSQKFEIANQ